MNAPPHTWQGHDAAARRLGFTVGELDGQFDAMLLVCAITLTAALSFMHPTATGDAWLMALLALLAAKWSAQVTLGAVVGLRALRQAPGTATRRWLRGWAQHQWRYGCGLSGIGFAVIAWHDGLASRAWWLVGLVVLAQGLAAWGGLAWRRQAHGVWLLWPLLGTAWVWHSEAWRHLAQPQPAPVWIGVGAGLAALGAVLLHGAHRRLAQAPQRHGKAANFGWNALDRLGRRARTWAAPWPLTTTAGTRWWEGTGSLLIWSVLWMPWGPGSHWGASLGPATPWSLLMWSLVLTLKLRRPQVHWRRALAPGAQLRPQLGWHLLAQALGVQAMALALTVTCGLLWLWAWGHPAYDYWVGTWRAWPAAFELLLATSVGVVLAAWTQRLDTRWIVNALLLLLVSGLAWGLMSNYLQRPAQVWGQVGFGYLAALLLASAALFPMCRLAWAQSDLHALMRRSAQAAREDTI